MLPHYRPGCWKSWLQFQISGGDFSALFQLFRFFFCLTYSDKSDTEFFSTGRDKHLARANPGD